MATVDLVYDPYDYTIDADPHPVWKRLRDEAPLYYNEKYDFYALSRFDEVFNIEPGEMLHHRSVELQHNIGNYWQGHIDERRRRPRDDIMSELIAADLETDDGSTRHLSDEELHAFYGLLSGAGNETVA